MLEECDLVYNCGLASARLILSLRAQSDVTSVFAIYRENCNKTAAKALRAIYRRPYFLPAMVDTATSNMVLVSPNYTGSVYKMVRTPTLGSLRRGVRPVEPYWPGQSLWYPNTSPQSVVMRNWTTRLVFVQSCYSLE